ncbi:MAG: hypothetical protein HY903_18115 [Deltaproteobacteria bacterium]|nr:hypothetical protein [Deltaproteobacteria bacterium]
MTPSAPRSRLLAALVGCMLISSSCASGADAPAEPSVVTPDPFLFGTEAILNTNNPGLTTAIDTIDNAFQVTTVKMRFRPTARKPTGDGFEVVAVLPNGQSLDLDDVAGRCQEHGYSLVPMISFAAGGVVTTAVIDDYVDFVDWFVNRYATSMKLTLIELYNNPGMDFGGTNAQLLELNNKTYDRVKSAHPDLLVATPGFEYWQEVDPGATPPPSLPRVVSQVEYFLDVANGARFDVWAFHGYQSLGTAPGGARYFYAPTYTTTVNKYAGVTGILEVRKALDDNGWQQRAIMDLEHTGLVVPGLPLDPNLDAVDEAYLAQDLILKRSLKVGASLAAAGLIALKLYPRSNLGEFAFGSLNADGSRSRAVVSMGVALRALHDTKAVAHVSGEFGRDDVAWVERFGRGTDDVFALFKPFKATHGVQLALDGESLVVSLALPRLPKDVVLTSADGTTQALTPSTELVVEAVNSPRYVDVNY